jgi:hypothetical protein
VACVNGKSIEAKVEADTHGSRSDHVHMGTGILPYVNRWVCGGAGEEGAQHG